MSSAWICDRCGDIADGAMCMKCGNPKHHEEPLGPKAGSYYSTIGFHTLDGFSGYGWIISAIFLIGGVAVGDWVLASIGGVIFSLFLWQKLRDRADR